MKTLRALAAALACSLLVASCSGRTAGGNEDLPPTDGPLTFTADGGGMSLWKPRDVDTWSGTFGGFRPCVDGAPAQVGRVEPLGDVDPDAFQAWIHSVPTGVTDLTGLGSELGEPPEFDQIYAANGVGYGDFKPAAGATIDEPCPANYQPYRGTGLTEFVISLDADTRGVVADGFTITYTSGGQRYQVTVNWEMMLCGTAMPTERCRAEADWN